MLSDHNVAGAAGRAAIIAGPLFLSLLLLFEFQRTVPATVDGSFGELLGLILPVALLTMASTVVGSLLAFPTCAAIGSALCFAADQHSLARSPIVWIAVGAGLAVAFLHFVLGSLDSSGSYAFIGTAVACAVIVRSRLRWE